MQITESTFRKVFEIKMHELFLKNVYLRIHNVIFIIIFNPYLIYLKTYFGLPSFP